MNIQIIQWNISYTSKPEIIAKQLQRYLNNKEIPTIMCLQEVSEKSYKTLINILSPSFNCFSLNLRPRGKNEGRNRALGVATLGFNLLLGSFDLVHRAVFPERTLAVTCTHEGKAIRLLNFHSLTGVDYKKAKSSNFASLADYLELNTDLDFMCCDANEPKVDSLYLENRIFYDNRDKGQNASHIFGSNSIHSLQDALVEYLKLKGEIESENPLAISFMTGNNPRRYDHIYSSKEWNVDRIDYKYEEAIKATSDHAIVIGSFHCK